MILEGEEGLDLPEPVGGKGGVDALLNITTTRWPATLVGKSRRWTTTLFESQLAQREIDIQVILDVGVVKLHADICNDGFYNFSLEGWRGLRCVDPGS